MIEIREVTKADIRKTYQDFLPHFNRRIKDFTATKLRTGDVHFIMMAFNNRVPIGLTAVYIDEKGHEAGVTIVKEEWRNQGVGTDLLKARYVRMPHTLSKVWEGNLPSKRICEKAYLENVDEEVFKERKILIFAKG